MIRAFRGSSSPRLVDFAKTYVTSSTQALHHKNLALGFSSLASHSFRHLSDQYQFHISLMSVGSAFHTSIDMPATPTPPTLSAPTILAVEETLTHLYELAPPAHNLNHSPFLWAPNVELPLAK
ncbi:hypothetical protein EW146_g9894 [Bondarzewia mesenterica]|uniref:Uncharacterized protein n=1 Tax=Bondarzewia mesenterica TaxID=1095465 RepID=A0A4V3XCD7_9AGAM|nr:hypothetical protein EW146_g9894 [Bondarzewia mesenterica]